LFSPTDPEAGRTKLHNQTFLGYKDHRAVDDAHGIITATLTTAASKDDGQMLPAVLDAHAQAIGQESPIVVADKGYGTTENYLHLHQRNLTPCIPHPVYGPHGDLLSVKAFTYDAEADAYICPEGEPLYRVGRTLHEGRDWQYRAPRGACDPCPIRTLCTENRKGRQISRHFLQAEVDWADAALPRPARKLLLRRRSIRAEGAFADAGRHGFKRARWRGRLRVTIQNLLIATLQNLRKLLKVQPPIRPVPEQSVPAFASTGRFSDGGRASFLEKLRIALASSPFLGSPRCLVP
jgi:IS5 family transposase